PAQRTDARRIEMNERVVADPATLSTRVGERRGQSEMFGDPPDRTVDLDVALMPEIEDVHLVARVLDCTQHRVDRIAHIKVRFALATIAEDLQPCRVGAQFFVKVEHMTVGVTLAQHGHEAEDKTAIAKALAKSGDQAFARDLRGTV